MRRSPNRARWIHVSFVAFCWLSSVALTALGCAMVVDIRNGLLDDSVVFYAGVVLVSGLLFACIHLGFEHTRGWRR